ncbi:Zinc metalloproteinase nas-7 [Pseudolycoriella hygida]|uniref:Metalloendopeptidase n=1 Tax=Pseudolycoriella hygida TaxID=35572 RepID=A0A9Q0MTN0_9DIPT|nr:Zinc metalloproteinase nas-7 [Pseudolycoriella hygida]
MDFLISMLFTSLLVSILDVTTSKSIEQIDLSHYGPRLFGNPSKDVGAAVEHWNENQSGNPEELGSYLEGDILFPRGNARNGLITETSRWPNGVIPFEIVGDFDARQMDLLEKAINSYHDNTCLKFVPKDTTNKDYISIQSSDSGCWSSVGRIGGRQVVNLQRNGCLTTIGTVIHELMHASGFTHEQNREERDDFVKILQQNIKADYANNFEKAPAGTTSGFGTTYDFTSVMHYSDHAFSSNGQPTIVSKKQFDGKMGQRDGFSKMDIEKINKMYKCSSTTTSSGYKPQVSVSSQSISGGIEDILSMIIPIHDKPHQMSNGYKKKSIL